MALNPRRRDRLLWMLGAAAAAVLLAQTLTRAHRPGGIDLTTYLAAAVAAERGDSPYALSLPFPYIYPPFLAFALIPLAHVPADAALVVWFAASIAAMLWMLRAIVHAGIAGGRGRRLTPFLALFLTAFFPIVQSNLRNGQVNFFVVALAVAALTAGGAAARGVSWALGIAIKILPAALAPFFLRRLDWRVWAAAAAALACFLALPVLAFGSALVPLTQQYVGSFLRGSYRVPWGAAALDFSLGGNLTRATGVDSQLVRQLGTVLPVLAAFVVDLIARRSDRSEPDAALFSLYLAVIPLASPKSEVHHLAFALPAAALIAGAVWFGVDRRPALLALLGIVVACYAGALILPAASGAFWFGFLVSLAAAAVVRAGPS